MPSSLKLLGFVARLDRSIARWIRRNLASSSYTLVQAHESTVFSLLIAMVEVPISIPTRLVSSFATFRFRFVGG